MLNFNCKFLLSVLIFSVAASLFAEEGPIIDWANTYGTILTEI